MSFRKLLAIGAVVGACSVNQASASDSPPPSSDFPPPSYDEVISSTNVEVAPVRHTASVPSDVSSKVVSPIHVGNANPPVEVQATTFTPAIRRDAELGAQRAINLSYVSDCCDGVGDCCKGCSVGCIGCCGVLSPLASAGLSIAELVLSAELLHFASTDPSTPYPHILQSLIGVYGAHLAMKIVSWASICGLECGAANESSAGGICGFLGGGICGAILAVPEMVFLGYATNALIRGATMAGQMPWLIGSVVMSSLSLLAGCGQSKSSKNSR